MIQALNQKTSEKMKKRKMSNSFHGIRPPQLEQPGAFINQYLDIQLIFIIDHFVSLREIFSNLSMFRTHMTCLLSNPGKGPSRYFSNKFLR